MGAASPRESAATTEALGSAEEAHRRCPEGRSEQLPARRAIQLGEGASKAKHRPPVGFRGARLRRGAGALPGTGGAAPLRVPGIADLTA
jgi:hypothetical protein